MRPIERGNAPQTNGIAKTVSDYKDWRLDLIDRMGNYCSYCNMVLNDSPQVEHVSPKSTNPALLLDWNNMLLACGPCNRAKSDIETSTTTHYLPDYHNTHMAFEYVILDHPKKASEKACVPRPINFDPVNVAKALETISLCNLQSLKLNPRATDLRWKYRYEAWVDSRLWRSDWNGWGFEVGDRFIELLITAAKAKGFFSLWFEAFSDVPAIKARLIKAFPATANCFDAANNYNPVQRNAPDL